MNETMLEHLLSVLDELRRVIRAVENKTLVTLALVDVFKLQRVIQNACSIEYTDDSVVHAFQIYRRCT